MSQIKVLVVDDDAGIRDMTNKILVKEDFEVIEAIDGLDGLDKFSKNRPDLLILDCMMPKMDGLELLKKIKEIEPDSTVIIFTAYATMEKAIEAMRYGARDFIVKPFKVEDFIAVINKYRETIELKKELKKSEEKRKNLQKQLKQAHEDLKKRYTVLQDEYAQLKTKVDEFQFISPTEKVKPALEEEEKKIIDKLGNSALIKYTTKEELTNSVEKIIDIFYKNGNPIIFITSQPRAFQSYKGVSELLQEGAIQIVDMSSGWAVGMQPSPYITIPLTHLFLFGDIIRKIPQNSVLIFEPLSQLILARGFETTYQFLENYSGELANRGITFIALLKTSAHSPEEVGGIENIFLNTVTVSVGGFI